jgi:hypothetical protein
MPLNRLDLVAPCVPPVAVHLEGDMAGDGPLGEGADKGRAQPVEGPFCGGRAQEPAAYPGEI